MLHLSIQSLDGTLYDGPVKQVTIPTLSGQITILPGHQPLVTVAMAGIIHLVPPEIDDTLLNKYIVTDKIINISISQGVVQIDQDIVSIIIAQASTKAESYELLEANKLDLMAKLKAMESEQNSDNYEDILNDIQKIDADIRLSKISGHI